MSVTQLRRSTASTRASAPEEGEVAPAPNRYASGHVIASKYRLEHVLGQGGMGSVWLARNLVLDVDVAIKLALGSVTSTTARARLLREAQTAARLQHPSIVRIYDFGETTLGDPFIVMEVVRGESIAELLDRRGRLTAVEAVQLLLPICSALSVAHGKGIVHRDVKPSNIIVMAGERGELLPKLVDFGIAKVDEPSSHGALTRTGMLIGSPDYMAPEQVRAKVDIDERVDVWALGVVLYEAITGGRPFGGPTASATLSEILVEEPPPLHSRGAGDEALWSILELALKKNRDERWSSVRAMGRALARWARSAGVETDASGTLLGRHWLSEGDERATSPPPEPRGTPRTAAPPKLQPHANRAAVITVGEPASNAAASVPLPGLHRRRFAWVGAALTVGMALLAGATLLVDRGRAVASPSPSPDASLPSTRRAEPVPSPGPPASSTVDSDVAPATPISMVAPSVSAPGARAAPRPASRPPKVVPRRSPRKIEPDF